MNLPFSATVRARLLEEAAAAPVDLIVVGGGITGAGILRDAALRGMNALLLEREDFGCGTSGRSSKLVHGGLRYLETFDWKLVFEACRERATLLKTAPGLVRPLPFLIPVYRGHRRGLAAVSAGVWLYDLLSLFHNVGHPTFHRWRGTMATEPGLRTVGLSGSALYFDAVTNDTILALATVKAAWRHGGRAVNHAEATEPIAEGNRVTGVRVTDRLTGRNYALGAAWVVNATGPWSDLFRAPISPRPALRLTKGVHLTLPAGRFRTSNAILMLAPSDGRVTFVIPWERFTLIGTTDTDYEGDPAQARAGREDVRYLLEAANHHFPAARLKPSDLLSTWAGVRPLLRAGAHSPSSLSREHRIFSDRPGFVTIAGGKLTTFRRMAEELLDWIVRETPGWRGRFKPCRTAKVPLAMGERRPAYGTLPAAAELRAMIETEMAATVEDLLARRTGLTFFSADQGRSCADAAAQALVGAGRITDEEARRQKEAYAAAAAAARAGL